MSGGDVKFAQFSIDLRSLKWILTDLFNEAGVAQLVEHHLAKVAVESSNLFARSTFPFGRVRQPHLKRA